ncbi:MAG: hypothetical protein E7578_03795 [Ruminococcaceae bacterium]|nr:hypothetical protein [Oscillospiraceae bacterium]
MKKTVSLVLTIAMIMASAVLFSVTGASVGSTGFYLELREEYSEGDTSIIADLHFHDPDSIGIAYFGLCLEYSDNMVLRRSSAESSGVHFSESVVKYPYMILGVADVDTGFTFPFEDTILASFEFDIIDSSYAEPFTVDITVDPENGVCDLAGNYLDETISLEGIFIEIKKETDDSGTDTEPDPEPEEIPDLDDTYYTGSDKIYVNENFMSTESFTKDFMPGAYFIQDGLLHGWPEAKSLQTNFTQTGYRGNSIFDNNSPYVWLTYDVSMTMSLSSSSTNEDRWMNICYCNDNLIYDGVSDSRQFITFSYDNLNGCFRLTDGWCNTSSSGQFMFPVYRDICMDGSEFITLGMSVEKNRIRCFYNNELIFDFVNSNLRIAKAVGSPLLTWNEGNIVRVANITIAEQGYLFPENGSHEEGFVVGSDGLLLNYYGNDTDVFIPDNVSKIGKFAFVKKADTENIILSDSVKEIEKYAFAKCRSVTIRDYGSSIAKDFCENNGLTYRRIYDGDVNDSGFVDAADVTVLARKFCGSLIDVSFGADFNHDGEVNSTDLVALRRWLAT